MQHHATTPAVSTFCLKSTLFNYCKAEEEKNVLNSQGVSCLGLLKFHLFTQSAFTPRKIGKLFMYYLKLLKRPLG